MKKHREMPSELFNTFIENDYVRVFNDSACFEGTVLAVDKDLIYFRSEEGFEFVIHFKQCRKLEEIKPRDFLIAINEDGEISNTDHMLKGFLLNGKPVKFVKVREVIE